MIDLSVVLICLNEEQNLARCLSSLPSGCEIIVIDSCSTDKTVSIAASYGAQVFQNPFIDFANQKNFALSKATRGWVLSLDADEKLSPSLQERIVKIVSQNDQKNSFFEIHRQLHFLGKKMRFGKTSDHPLRLLRRGSGFFSGTVHEKILDQITKTYPNVQQIKEPIIHYSYRDLSDYFSKFNRYTTMVAEKHILANDATPTRASVVLRPWIIFLQRYFLYLGFLDGYQGYVWALLGSVYSFTKYAKQLEFVERNRRALR